MSIDCLAASAKSAIARDDNNAQQTNPAKARRFVEVLKIGNPPEDPAWHWFLMRLD
jgi:hypothetical protein